MIAYFDQCEGFQQTGEDEEKYENKELVIASEWHV